MENTVFKSTRAAVGEALLELARAGKDVVAVSADTGKSMYTDMLKSEFPLRSIEVGIAEQNMMMIAAGLASTGKIAFAVTYSNFASMRCCEQVRTFIAYPNLNVKIIGGIGGFSSGIEGVTHVATEDLGIMRCIPNITVIAPCDYNAAKDAVNAAAAIEGPVYIRVGRDPSPLLTNDNYKFEIGRPVLHREGRDVTLIASGLVLEEALKAASALEKEGITANVIEVHTLKPLNGASVILDCVMRTRNVITVEEHNIVGGLATVIAELLFKNEITSNIKQAALGMNDSFAQSGTPDELRIKYGVDFLSIINYVKSVV